uniref:Peptidase S1 domain-containing protein n=1 Tax=Mola mola TaxID=94237 RepID=A0A3Q3X5Y4_MOLML
EKVELCGGVLLGQFSVLTAARCLYQESDIQPYNFYKYLPVRALYIHEQFCPDRHNNDLALLELTQPLTFSSTLIHLCLPTKDFSENILMHPGKMGITRSQGASQIQKLSYMMLDDCRITMNISHQLSNKMFCMKKNRATRRCNGSLGKQTAESLAVDRNLTITRQCGHLLPGMPVATVDRGTVFLTGLLTSSSTDCDGLVFTKLSRYLSWIKSRLEESGGKGFCLLTTSFWCW